MPNSDALSEIPVVVDPTDIALHQKNMDLIGGISTRMDSPCEDAPVSLDPLSTSRKGIFTCEGLPSVRAKIVVRIKCRKFIEMGEHLTEFWLLPQEEDGMSKGGRDPI